MRHAIEFGFVKAKGGSEQTLASGNPPVILNEIVFNSPQKITNDFDIDYADVSYRWRKFFRNKLLGFELFGGLGYTSLGLKVSSSTQEASDSFDSYGGQGGAGLMWRLRPGSSLHGRVSAYNSVSIGFSRAELFFMQTLGDNLSLRAGYAYWKLNDTDRVFGDDSLEIKFSGPILSLGLDF